MPLADLSQERLRRLLEIASLLVHDESAATSLRKVLETVAHALPLQTAVLLRESPAGVQLDAWKSADVPLEALRDAQRHARAAYASQLRHVPGGAPHETGDLQEATAESARYILLPLVVGRGPVFGALQLGDGANLQETDLLVADVLVRLFSIAIDRRAARERLARAEAMQRMLAEVSAELGAVWRDPAGAMVRAAHHCVATLGAICFVDRLVDGQVERLFVPHGIPAGLRRAIEHAAGPLSSWDAPQRRVLRTGTPLRLGQGSHALAGSHPTLIVPLRVDQSVLGTLTLINRRGAVYGPDELALAQEVANRMAVALESARQYRDAQRATRSRQQLLAVVSHDLRNPLGSILMTVAALGRTAALPDTMTRGLERIRQASLRMRRLIADLLDAANLEQGRLSIQRDAEDARALVEEALASEMSLARARSLRLVSDIPHQLPVVLCDRERVLQVFSNLLENAFKFTPEGGRVAVSARASTSEVRFSVSDSGPGIPEENLPHVFDRYWQAEHTAKLGSGLGLAISRGIIEAHGGTIGVESTLGSGTRFCFTLPVAHLPEKPAPERIAHP